MARLNSIIEKLANAKSQQEIDALANGIHGAPSDFETRALALVHVARAYQAVGASQRAERVLLDLIDACERQPESGFATDAPREVLAQVLAAQGRYEEVDAIYAQMLTSESIRDDPHARLGLLCTALSTDSRSLHQPAFLTAAAADLEHSTDPKLFLIVGVAAWRMGETATAVRLHERGYRMARRLGLPEYVPPLITNLVAMSFPMDLARVAQYSPAAIAVNAGRPKDLARLLLQHAAACDELGYAQDGLAAVERLAEIPQSEPSSRAMRILLHGQFLVRLKRHHEAVGVFAELNDKTLPREMANIAQRARERLERELDAPWSIDCPHEILTLLAGGTVSQIDHSNRTPFPAADIDPQSYREAGLAGTDREQVEALAGRLIRDGGVTYLGQSAPEWPSAMTQNMIIEYVDDVARFEQLWRLHRHEIEVRAMRAELRRAWPRITRGLPGNAIPNASIEDVDEFMNALINMAKTAQLFAQWGDRREAHQLVGYCAPFVEVSTNDPASAAIIWSVRAGLISAASLLGTRAPLAGVEVDRCLDQFLTLLPEAGEEAGGLLVAVAPIWSWIGTRLQTPLRRIADLADSLERVQDVDPDVLGPWIELLSLAGRHGEVRSILDVQVARLRLANPTTRLVVPEDVGTCWGSAVFRTLAHDEDSCSATFGPFGTYIHAEVDRGTLCHFPTHGPALDYAVDAMPGPLAFSDGHLIVMANGLDEADFAAAMTHETVHINRRNGQTLQTADGEWRLVKRDVPIAAAVTYSYVSQDATQKGTRVVDATVRRLMNQGADHARINPESASGHIGNMLSYFDAMGEQEGPASYACAALLAGMASGFMRDPDRAINYLHHLAVVDHDEALFFAHRDSTLRL